MPWQWKKALYHFSEVLLSCPIRTGERNVIQQLPFGPYKKRINYERNSWNNWSYTTHKKFGRTCLFLGCVLRYKHKTQTKGRKVRKDFWNDERCTEYYLLWHASLLNACLLLTLQPWRLHPRLHCQDFKSYLMVALFCNTHNRSQ
jgi:hypothetical protein